MLFSPQILVRRQPAIVVAASTTSWDSGNKFQITLSTTNISNDTATNSVGPGNFGVVRSLASYSTGQKYNEWLIVATDGNQVGIGVCNASQALSGAPFMGTGANNAGILSSNGSVVLNGGSPGLYAGSAVANGDVVSQAIDIGAKLGWWRLNGGNWNNSGAANPATGAGGYDISAVTGDLYLFAEIQSNGCTGVLRTRTADFTRTVPGSFGNW
jgi:hypothetical protein